MVEVICGQQIIISGLFRYGGGFNDDVDDEDDGDDDVGGGDDVDDDDDGERGEMWSVNNSFWLVRSQQKSKNQESSFVADI